MQSTRAPLAKSNAALRSREEDEASWGADGFRIPGEPGPGAAGVLEIFGGLMERSFTGDSPRSWS